MCSCHSILECCVMFSGVKLSIRSFVLFFRRNDVHIKRNKSVLDMHQAAEKWSYQYIWSNTVYQNVSTYRGLIYFIHSQGLNISSQTDSLIIIKANLTF